MEHKYKHIVIVDQSLWFSDNVKSELLDAIVDQTNLEVLPVLSHIMWMNKLLPLDLHEESLTNWVKNDEAYLDPDMIVKILSYRLKNEHDFHGFVLTGFETKIAGLKKVDSFLLENGYQPTVLINFVSDKKRELLKKKTV